MSKISRSAGCRYSRWREVFVRLLRDQVPSQKVPLEHLHTVGRTQFAATNFHRKQFKGQQKELQCWEPQRAIRIIPISMDLWLASRCPVRSPGSQAGLARVAMPSDEGRPATHSSRPETIIRKISHLGGPM